MNVGKITNYVTPKAQGKILVNQFTQLAKEQKYPINSLTKTEKALTKELNSPSFKLHTLREKIMNLSEEIMLGLKK